MSLNYSFAGRRVLVTGGGQGIGRQLVQRFHDDGAVVLTLDKNPEGIKQLQQDLPGVTAHFVDITDWDATRKAIESFGKVDHLVNNAGIFVDEPFLEITQEAALQQFKVNVIASINTTQVVAKGMKASGGGGSIVNIASIGAQETLPRLAVYCTTKAAVEALTRSMAVELGPDIRVNCVSPGLAETEMGRSGPEEFQEKRNAMMNRRLVIKRLVDPNEIADLVFFLLSPLSKMITGECVNIDGGTMANLGNEEWDKLKTSKI